MACTSSIIPPYLHTNDRPVLPNDAFLDDHRIYRLGNPIEFPNGTYTAFSCKWSHLINEADVLIADDPPVSNHYKYAFVEALKAYRLKVEKTDGDNLGWHKLTCELEHIPTECDYSHCEVYIRHSIFSSEDEVELLNSWFCTYEGWIAKEYILQGKTTFYKTLRKDYRAQVIALFPHP